MNLIVHLSRNSEYAVDLIGNKAYNLQKLNNNRFPIPNTYCITTKAIKNLGAGSWTHLKDKYDELISNTCNGKIALRSSTLLEDSTDQSYAGLFESYLNIETFDELQTKIEAIKTKYSVTNQPIALIIQEMISADFAGVIFTKNPLDGNDEILIEATRGLADKMLAGTINPWHAKISGGKVIKNETGIDDSLLKTLAREACKIEKLFGSAQDIEWAIFKGKIYFIQSRPITTMNAAKTDFWSRKPMDERFPTVLKPLDWTFQAEWGLQNGFADLLRFLGIKSISSPLFTAKAGLMHINFTDFRKLPIVNTREMILQGEEPIFESPIKGLSFALKMFRIALSRPGQWREHLKNYQKQLPTGEEDIADQFRKIKKASLIVFGGHFRTIFVLIFLYGLLTKLGWKGEHLVYAKRVNKTQETNDDLRALAKIYEQKPRLRNMFANDYDSKTILEEVERTPNDFNALRLFIHKYGHRANSYELSFPRWDEEPVYVIDMLKSLVLAHNKEKPSTKKKLPPHLSYLSRLYCQFLDLRENENFYNHEITYMFKKLIIEQGQKWEREGLIYEAKDVFFMTIQEIEQMIFEKKRIYGLKDLIEARLCEFEELKEKHESLKQISEAKDVITGVTVSPGITTGRAVVFSENKVRKISKQDIVVTKNLISSMVGLVNQAAGIVTEYGGLLSHGAILCREMSVPAISLVENATSLINDGQLITLDATNGKILTVQRDGDCYVRQ